RGPANREFDTESDPYDPIRDVRRFTQSWIGGALLQDKRRNNQQRKECDGPFEPVGELRPALSARGHVGVYRFSRQGPDHIERCSGLYHVQVTIAGRRPIVSWG